MSDQKIALLILAAGESSRMGQPKQLLPWKGSTLLEHSIQEALKSKADDVYVVLGAHYAQTYPLCNKYQVNILNNTDWSLDLGHSIRFGLESIQNKRYDGVLLILADQPQVDSKYLNTLITTFKSLKFTKSILATAYPENIGIPILFGSQYFKDFINNTSTKGGKSILKKYGEQIKRIQPHSPLEDIDTLEDYQRLYKKIHLNR